MIFIPGTPVFDSVICGGIFHRVEKKNRWGGADRF